MTDESDFFRQIAHCLPSQAPCGFLTTNCDMCNICNGLQLLSMAASVMYTRSVMQHIAHESSPSNPVTAIQSQAACGSASLYALGAHFELRGDVVQAALMRPRGLQ